MSRYHIRPYQTGDEISINRGFNQVFGTTRSLDDWHWKFQPDTYGDRIMVAVDDDGLVVAHFAAQAVQVQIDGATLQVGHAVDLFSLRPSDVVRHRIFQKTAQAFYERYGRSDVFPLLIGFPGLRSLQLGRLQLGYCDPVPISYWERSVRRYPAWTGSFRVQEGATPADLDRLWEQAARRYPVAVIRNGAWLHRRYLSRPGHTYRHVLVRKGDELQAWGVFQVEQDRVLWVDVLWDGRMPRALVALDKALLRLARTHGTDRQVLWLNNDPEVTQILQKRGWKSRPNPNLPCLTAVALMPERDVHTFIKRLYFTMGDADLV